MYLISLCLVIAALSHRAGSSDVFDPECTLPKESVNMVKSPNARGTSDILWFTVYTLLVCTYSVQHLNIPPRKTTARQVTWKGWFRDIVQDEWPSIMWTLITIIAPEIVVALAFQDWKLCRRFFEVVDGNGDRQNIRWEKTHVYFANMGGFPITLQKVKDDEIFYSDPRTLQILKKVSKIHEEWRKSSFSTVHFHYGRLQQNLERERSTTLVQSSEMRNPSVRDDSDGNSLQEDLSQHPNSYQPSSSRSRPDEHRDGVRNEQDGQPSPSAIHPLQNEDEILPILQDDVISSNATPSAQQTHQNTSTSARQRKKLSKSKDPESDEVETESVELILTAIQLYVAQILGLIVALPSFPENDIRDKSKAGVGWKLIVLGQIGWFFKTMVQRYADGMYVSQLETAVLAYCLCCFLAICFYWHKPRSVMTPTIDNNTVSPRVALDVDIRVLEAFTNLEFIKTTFVPPFASRRRSITLPIPHDAMDGVFFTVKGVGTHYAEITAVIAGVAFGVVYFAAWWSSFPSHIELLLWRISTCLAAGGPILYDIANIVMSIFYYGDIRHAIFLYSIAVFYLAARIFLIVEMFRTLFYLPPSAYAA